MGPRFIQSRFNSAKESGQGRHALLRFGAVVGVVGVVLVGALFLASSTVAARHGSNSAAGVQFFIGDKTCQVNSAPPYVTCYITTSNVPLLQGARIDYVSVPENFTVPSPGRDDSDVILTTAVMTGGKPSTAYGHCTFYWLTGTGVCIYTRGTNDLAGFNATLAIGTNSDGTFSVIGKYWFED